METELSPFTLPEMSQTPTDSKTLTTDIISSWLDMDDIYTPTFPEELQDIHMLNDNFFQFTPSEFETDPFSLIPRQEEYSSDSFLLDLSEFHPYPTNDAGDHLPLFPEMSVNAELTAPSAVLIEEDDGDCFFNDDLCLIAPSESFFDHVLGPPSTPTTASTSEIYPQTNVGPLSNQEDEEEEEEEVETDDDPKPGTLNCKNLLSERNRRKRLSQQLLALRALVPNITKMDKRSVLVDALAYLKGIHEETARIQTELKERSASSTYNKGPCLDNTTSVKLQPSLTLAPLPRNSSKTKAQILEIDTEKIEDRRFVVKITCKGGTGIGGEVLRVMESLGFEITYTALEQIKPMHVLTTVFIRIRKQGRMTEERLKDSITSTALRSGLMLKNP